MLSKFEEIIKQDYPDFKIKSIKSLKGGCDNFVVEINKTYIFRFPKNKDFKLAKEIKILKKIRGKITLEIPVYEFIGRNTPYVGYRKIMGQPLSRNILDKLSLKEKNILAFDIAKFFYEFHSSLSINESKSLGLEKNLQSWRPIVIKKKIIGKLKNKELDNFIKINLDKYLKLNKEEANLVVAYNDLHGENLAFDKKNYRLKGIFDFSDVAIEDVHREFCSLLTLDNKLALKVIKEYEKLSGRIINIERVFIYSVISEASILATYIDKPNTRDYKYAMNDLLDLKNFFCEK